MSDQVIDVATTTTTAATAPAIIPTDPAHRPKVLILTPACILDGRHLGMCRVQALLKRRLAKRLPGVDFVSVLVVDGCRPEHRDEMENVAKEFDLVRWEIPIQHGTAWGIRKPTNYAVTDIAEEIGATHVLRVIQDTFVVDIDQFAGLVRDAVAQPGDWIAAAIHNWKNGGSHRGLCDEMGLACTTPEMHYPNGAMMLAPVETWRRWYVTLPASINHYFDDVMMGEVFRQRGPGRFLDWPTCWLHQHNCSVEESRAVYTSHLEPEVTMSVCAILKNEGRYVGEWIEFHRLVGVERFVLYDHGSTDDTREQIERHNRGDITVYPWTGQQLEAYNHYLENHRYESKWCAVLDGDEFLFSPYVDALWKALADYDEPPYLSAIFVNWLMFGSNGHEKRPTGLVTENYTRRAPPGQPNTLGKVVIRPARCQAFVSSPHNAVPMANYCPADTNKGWAPGAASAVALVDRLRINHYFGKSIEDQAEKIARGYAWDRQRTWDEMRAHDRNDEEDVAIQRFLPALRAAMAAAAP